MSKRIVPTLLAIALAAVTTTAAAPALADEAANVDWLRLLTDVDTVMKKGADVVDSPRCALAGCQTDTNVTAAAPLRIDAAHSRYVDNTFFSVAPKFALIARDWTSSFKVSGDRLALVDGMRLTSSTRMLLGRVRANASRVSPFLQVGLGQWRIDPYLLPRTQRFSEIAAEAAAGVEVRVMGTWRVALETSTTMLYREYREPRDLAAPATQIWNTSCVSRVDF